MWYPGLVEPRFGAPKGQPVARGRSLTEFQKGFPDEAGCAAFLFKRRWPDGFVCPSCGGNRAAALKSWAYTFECYGCGRQTSITAGTAMHRTRLPLTAWFWAAHLMATHSNGMSARQLEDHRPRQSAQGNRDAPPSAEKQKDRDRNAPGRHRRRRKRPPKSSGYRCWRH